jgi:beta-lactamase regulating signal transducer with metallopeptidase domain
VIPTLISTANLHPVALLISERVMACLVAGTVLTACAGLALRLMSRQTAQTKFALCFTTLAGVALVPLLGWWHAQGATTSAGASTPMLRLPEEWAAYICGVWAVGASIALARVAFGLYRVHQVRRSCVPVGSAEIDLKLQRAVQEFQSQRGVELCTSELVRVPTAIGFMRPVVALPGWCLRDLSPSELHSVVLHELEHLRRYDDWTNFFQRIVGAMFFFHPAIWWLESRLSLEREIACDDAVLAVVPDPKSYARCLVSLAEKSYLRRGIALAQAAVSRVQQLTARITQILDARRPIATSIWKPALSIVAVTVFAGSASLEVGPRLVAFQSRPAQSNHVSASAVVEPAAAPVQSPEPEQNAFDLRPTPARFVVQAPLPTPTHKFTHNRTLASSVSAVDSTPHLPLASRRTIASERTVFAAAPVETAGPGRAAFNPDPRGQIRQGAATSIPSAQMLLMVVHSAERDESGAIFWSVRVVELVVFHPQMQNRAADPQVPAKT